jgi:hypothetical protein
VLTKQQYYNEATFSHQHVYMDKDFNTVTLTCLTGLKPAGTEDSFRTCRVFLGPSIEVRGDGRHMYDVTSAGLVGLKEGSISTTAVLERLSGVGGVMPRRGGDWSFTTLLETWAWPALGIGMGSAAEEA